MRQLSRDRIQAGGHRLATFVVATTSLVAAACLGNDQLGPLTDAPQFLNVYTRPNPNNALSTVVTFTAVAVDSARVEYWSGGEPRGSTPCYPTVKIDSSVITVLGLRPTTAYSYVVRACGPRAQAVSTLASLSTDQLPRPLQGVRLEITGTASAGYSLTSFRRDSVGFVVAFDSSGDIRWYRQFALRLGEDAQDAQQLATGDFTVFLGGSTGWQPTYGRFVQFHPGGEVVRAYAASAPYYTDLHELDVAPGDGGTVSLFGYDLRAGDLSSIGGATNALVSGHTLLRQTQDGSVVFFWSAWDHFQFEDWIEPPFPIPANPNIDFDHPNAFVFDQDSNYVISWRNFGEVTKIDGVSGQIIWRLGGRHNQFTFVDDPFGGFSGQHCVRLLDDGDLLLFDNGLRHNPPESRAVQYRLDTRAMTATMVWQYRHNPPLFTPFVGSVQRYADGRTLIGFGWASTVVEVGPAGDWKWEGHLTFDGSPPPFFYRMWKVPSLYSYERP